MNPLIRDTNDYLSAPSRVFPALADVRGEHFPQGFVDVCQQLAPLPTVMTKKLMPASPSAIDKMMTCPRQFDAAYKGIHVKKIKFVQNKAVIRGEIIHKAFEDWVSGNTSGLRDIWMLVKQRIHERSLAETECPFKPDELAYIQPGAIQFWQTKLDYLKTVPQHQLEFATGWNSITGESGWYTRQIGCKMDYWGYLTADTVLYVDYKTGKVYDKPLQLEIAALVLFATRPEVNTVIADYWFIDQKDSIRYVFRRAAPYAFKQVPSGYLQVPLAYISAAPAYWDNQQNNQYDPARNFLCKDWCQVTDCQYHGKARP